MYALYLAEWLLYSCTFILNEDIWFIAATMKFFLDLSVTSATYWWNMKRFSHILISIT